MYVHWDGYPSHHLPLLLAAHQHRFAGSLDAMTRHLIDDVPVGWSALGTDLLDGAPDELITALTRGERYASDQLDVITPDGSPPTRMTVRDGQASGLDWGYVLHDHGIEVISLREEQHGPVVGWATDPRTRFSDHPALWQPTGPVPGRPPSPAPKLTTTAMPPAAGAATPHPARR
ncbi:hypothetical protein K7B10_07825 [Streptomyces flavotricini]|uniref:Uncharacterized protein n=2 Tax=Streptomyces flavotricini TaxID=66888 RepID=A0ABS8E168_9ACTN|nr:hypothetical protein [Streptomyces flavotricini]